MEMQGANTHPIPKNQQLAVIPETSRSSKTPSETSVKITGISCYLGSGINMYDITHMYKETQNPNHSLSCPKAGRAAGCPPDSARRTDGVVQTLANTCCVPKAWPAHHGKCPAAGTALPSVTWFNLRGRGSPTLKREKSIPTASAVKVISNNK